MNTISYLGRSWPFSSPEQSVLDKTWIVDSGSSRHVTCQDDWFASFVKCIVVTSLLEVIFILGMGTVQLNFETFFTLQTFALTLSLLPSQHSVIGFVERTITVIIGLPVKPVAGIFDFVSNPSP